LKSKHVLGPIRKIFFFIIIAFFTVLISFTYLLYQSEKKENEDKLVINIFGRQRMYTQQMSKDASLLYALMLSLNSGANYNSEEEVVKKIEASKENLSRASKDFSDILAAMHKGELNIEADKITLHKSILNANGYLSDIDALWLEFDQAVETMITSTVISDEVIQAVLYISDNNLKLLELSDDILDLVLEDAIYSGKIRGGIFYSLIAFMSILIFVALFHMLQNIVIPFHQLYKGISEIGLDKYPLKPGLPTRRKVTPIVSEINDTFKKINDLITLIENITNNASFMEVLNYINHTFSSFIPYNYIGIALIDKNKKSIRASYGVSDGTVNGLPEKIMGASWNIHDTSLDKLLRTGDARIINDLTEYTAGKPLKPYNKVILEAGIRASITLPLKVSGEPVGFIFFSSKTKNVYNNGHVKILKTLANSMAISLNQNIFINDLLYGSVLALAKLAEARDEDTGDHLERMRIYSRVIAELLYESNIYRDQITLEYIENIERFSPLHDIGKVGIRDEILLKPGKLTTDEFEAMKRHATYGAEVLRAAEYNISQKNKSLFGMGIDIAEGHHEKWNGTGYPYGKQGEDIPLSARIVAIADVFDALTSKRPYKEAFTFEAAVRIIREGSGKHFDPKIVKVFMENIDEIEKVYEGFLKSESRVS
jgi:HD-GYP domain-containing protein (c-di-GMP phosphodiesterase class II)